MQSVPKVSWMLRLWFWVRVSGVLQAMGMVPPCWKEEKQHPANSTGNTRQSTPRRGILTLSALIS